MHNYLYKFSLDRFETFIRDGPIITLFNYYFQNHARARIESSSIMKRYREAYYEAADIILQTTKEEVTPATRTFNASDLMSAHVSLESETIEAEPNTGVGL